MTESYNAAHVTQARLVFDALAEGGTIAQPLQLTFFSEAFGTCVERFGTPRMIVRPATQQPLP
jgi:PhnB protein